MAISKPIAVLVFVGVLGGAWWALRTPPDAAPQKSQEPAVSPPKPATPASPVTAEFKMEPAEKVPVERRLKMPDGSFVPTLNGVLHPANIVWGDVPYSPIVRKQIDPTVEWYVHADGTFTTTMMQWRSDLGRTDAVTLCLHPVKPISAEPVGDEGGAAKKQ